MTDRTGLEPVTFRPIGVIRTPYPDATGMPIQRDRVRVGWFSERLAGLAKARSDDRFR